MDEIDTIDNTLRDAEAARYYRKFRERQGRIRTVDSLAFVLLPTLVMVYCAVVYVYFGNATNYLVLGGAASLVVILSVVFQRIFGVLPFSWMMDQTSGHTFVYGRGPFGHFGMPIDAEAEAREFKWESPTTETLAKAQPREIVAYYSLRSRKLAEALFNRAGVYLMVGAITAMGGLAFFYINTRFLPRPIPHPDPMTLTELMSQLLPGLGVLFFIELVAFFFLRQYRAAMDEFRYYDAVARTREEVFAMLRLAEAGGDQDACAKLALTDRFFSSPPPLATEQIQAILELRKGEKNEALDALDLLRRLVRGDKGDV